MNSTDKILIDLYSNQSLKPDKSMPARDRKILYSLFRQLTGGHFLTENQGKLLVKIFKENYTVLDTSNADLLDLIENPIWSEPFRKIEQVRKIYLDGNEDRQIVIEFTFNKRIREQFARMSKELDGGISSIGNKKHSVALTEKNLLILLKGFKNFNFTIDQKIIDFYQEIEEILKTADNPFVFEKLENTRLINNLQRDISENDLKDTLLINDRKIRYQYEISPNFEAKTLTEKIACRSTVKLYADKKIISLDAIIKSLIDLKRLPLLCIFSGHDSRDSNLDLLTLSSALEKNNINCNVGIYFRFDNTTQQHKNFNDTLSTLKYNSKLNNDTKVVGLANNKLPKFIVKENWKPNSIISFTNTFKNNKTSVYCDNVDLIIYYHDKEPLGDISAIL